MSTIRLLILGVVRSFQPVHGYDVRRELLSWHADEWANVAPGSIYHALRTLAGEGLLTHAGTDQVGARPERIRYTVTRTGENEFQELLRRYWWQYQPAIDPFVAALAFLPALPAQEGAAALHNRARMLRLFCDGMRVRLAGEFARAQSPPHVAEMLLLQVARAQAEADWCDRVAVRVAAGELDLGQA